MLEKKKKFRKDIHGNIREVRKETIFDTLKRVVEQEKLFDLKENKTDINLNKRWQNIVGNNLGAITSVSASKTGILTIEAKSSVAVQEIKLLQNEILLKFKTGEPVYVFKKITIKLKS